MWHLPERHAAERLQQHAAAALAAMLAAAQPLCNCTARMADIVSRAPSLFQAGTIQAVNPFRGATPAVLTGALVLLRLVGGSTRGRAPNRTCCPFRHHSRWQNRRGGGSVMPGQAEQCATVVRDVDKSQLLDELYAERAVKVLAGVSDMAVTTLPRVDVAGHLRMMQAVQQCVAAAAASSDDAAGAAGEEPSTSSGGDGVLPAQAAARGVPAGCAAFVDAFTSYAGPSLRIVAGAEQDVHDAYAGYLGEVVYNMGTLLPAVNTMVKPDAWATYVAAAGRAANASGCADVAVQLSGLASLQQSLQQPATVLRDLAGTAQADVDDALEGYQARRRAALKRLSRAQDRILVMLANSNAGGSTRVCEDSSMPVACPIDACAAAGPAATETDGGDGGNTTSAGRASCPPNTRCIMDGCARCAPECMPVIPVADASAALEVLKA